MKSIKRVWHHREACTYPLNSHLKTITLPGFQMKVPADSWIGETIQLIAEVRDNGSPALTRYRRIIVQIVR